MSESENLAKAVVRAIDDLDNETPSMDRQRPYNGQRHTGDGIRGATIVEGLTMRDIRDCYIRGLVLSHEATKANGPYIREACKGEGASLCIGDVFRLDGDFDPLAAAQNMGCEIEKMMGIFPNTDNLGVEDFLKEIGVK